MIDNSEDHDLSNQMEFVVQGSENLEFNYNLTKIENIHLKTMEKWIKTTTKIIYYN
jgi:uncharacterized HAD superfamily protein